MLAYQDLLERPQSDHLVQFHSADEQALAKNVERYVAAGLRAGDGIILIGTPEYTSARVAQIEESMGSLDAMKSSGQLQLLDGRLTLERILLDGNPSAEAFDRVVGSMIRDLRARSPSGLRVVEAMGGMLWADHQYSCAASLERLWHQMVELRDCSLFCAYPIDIFNREFEPRVVDELLCAHTHLLPACDPGKLKKALARAIEELAEEAAKEARQLRFNAAWGEIPSAEATILWLRERIPQAQSVIELARSYYRKSLEPAVFNMTLSAYAAQALEEFCMTNALSKDEVVALVVDMHGSDAVYEFLCPRCGKTVQPGYTAIDSTAAGMNAHLDSDCVMVKAASAVGG
ncbi:MAG: MEDS domain-containing protein [Candidatus Baltobacteraceae bacterium]